MASLDLLDPRDVARLRAAPFTYPEIGATASAEMPTGYHRIHRSARVSTDGGDLEGLASALLRWQVQRGVGLRVAASEPVAGVGSVVLLRAGLGPVSVRIPCRVVYLVDEPDRRGFAYGTLPGHPESGEEMFVLERRDDGVHLVVRAFSRPGTLPARLAGPVGRGVQSWMTGRYLRALGR